VVRKTNNYNPNVINLDQLIVKAIHLLNFQQRLVLFQHCLCTTIIIFGNVCRGDL